MPNFLIIVGSVVMVLGATDALDIGDAPGIAKKVFTKLGAGLVIVLLGLFLRDITK